MFADYATHADPDNPLAALKIGERPEPSVPDGWTRGPHLHRYHRPAVLFMLMS